MGNPDTRLIRFTLSSASGMTLVELLVAMGVGIVLMGACLSVGLSSRSIYQYDQARTELNQNLRITLDIFGADVREAGERLPRFFPAIEVTNGAGTPDEVVLRRNLLDEVLPVCTNIATGTQAPVHIAVQVAPPAGCEYDSQVNNFTVWQNYRMAREGEVQAYIYNTITRQGEFFIYSGETDSGTEMQIRRKAGTGSWQRDYPAGAAAVYILEERRYRVQNGFLQLIPNHDTANPQNVIYGVQDFQVLVHMQDGTVRDSLVIGDNWATLKALEVVLSGEEHIPGRTIQRTLATPFFPRNVLSH